MQGVCDDRWEPVTANVLTSRHALNMELHDWDGVRVVGYEGEKMSAVNTWK